MRSETKVHRLKILQKYYEAVRDGRKTFELRINDRGFQEGDFLILMEYNPNYDLFSGREIRCKIGYILPLSEFVHDSEYVILSLVDEAHYVAE